MTCNSKLGFLALGLVFLLFSCGKDEPLLPTDEAHLVSLELSRSSEKLYNEVKVISKVEGDVKVEKVVFFLNENLLGEKTEAPYEILWNTKNVDDGKYSMKIVVYGGNGTKSEVSQDVVVKNTLLSVKTEDGYIKNEQKHKLESWIFLSDKNGNIVGDLQQLTNGASLKWERPVDFNSDTVYFNHLVYEGIFGSYLPIEYLTVNTYSNLAIDEIYLRKTKYVTELEAFGWAQGYVENDFDGLEMFQYSTATRYNYQRRNSSANLINLGPIYMNVEGGEILNCYTRYYDVPGKREKFYSLDNIQGGNSYTFHTSKYTAMEEVVIPLTFDYVWFAYQIDGYLSPEDEMSFRVDYNEFMFEDNETGKAKFFYADEFPVLYTTTYAHTETNKRIVSYIKGLPPKDYTLPDFSSSVSRIDSRNIQVSTQGSFDIGTATWRYKGKEEPGVFVNTRSLHFNSQSGIKYTLPEIPASLLKMYPELNNQLESSYIYLLDNKTLETYTDVLKYRLTNKFSSTDHNEYSSITLAETKEGGRIMPGQDNLLKVNRLEEEHLRAKGIF